MALNIPSVIARGVGFGALARARQGWISLEAAAPALPIGGGVQRPPRLRLVSVAFDTVPAVVMVEALEATGGATSVVAPPTGVTPTRGTDEAASRCDAPVVETAAQTSPAHVEARHAADVVSTGLAASAATVMVTASTVAPTGWAEPAPRESHRMARAEQLRERAGRRLAERRAWLAGRGRDDEE